MVKKMLVQYLQIYLQRNPVFRTLSYIYDEGFFCKNTKYLSVFSPNAGKCGPGITPNTGTFYAMYSKAKS